jgi:hypothetical protein
MSITHINQSNQSNDPKMNGDSIEYIIEAHNTLLLEDG